MLEISITTLLACFARHNPSTTGKPASWGERHTGCAFSLRQIMASMLAQGRNKRRLEVGVTIISPLRPEDVLFMHVLLTKLSASVRIGSFILYIRKRSCKKKKTDGEPQAETNAQGHQRHGYVLRSPILSPRQRCRHNQYRAPARPFCAQVHSSG